MITDTHSVHIQRVIDKGDMDPSEKDCYQRVVRGKMREDGSELRVLV